MQKLYSRNWCVACNDWELFGSDSKCTSCGKEHESIKLGDIPEEKLEEQRKRWNKQQRYNAVSKMNAFACLSGVMLPNVEGVDHNVFESDAGQKRIDEIRKERIEQEIAFRKEEREKYKDADRSQSPHLKEGA